MNTLLCHFCSAEFIPKRINKKKPRKFCSTSCYRHSVKSQKQYLSCLNCNLPTKSKFCNSSCSATYNNKLRNGHSHNTRLKISESLQKYYLTHDSLKKGVKKIKTETPLYTKLYGLNTCNYCGITFWATSPGKKCCSKICRDNICSQNHVRKKHIPFNHNNEIIFLDSNWEVIIAEYLNSLSIHWQRPTQRLLWIDHNGKQRTYLPDFFLTKSKIYLDVKNPVKQAQDAIKIDILTSKYNLFVGDIEYIKDVIWRSR